jgi:hypothetical protein
MATSDLMDEIMSRGCQNDDQHKNLVHHCIFDNHGRTAFVQPSTSLNELYHVVELQQEISRTKLEHCTSMSCRTNGSEQMDLAKLEA